jgi:hypothetical protein
VKPLSLFPVSELFSPAAAPEVVCRLAPRIAGRAEHYDATGAFSAEADWLGVAALGGDPDDDTESPPW